MGECPFCKRIDARDYEQDYAAQTVVRFEPLNPVTPGHMLFVPGEHLTHPSSEGVRAAMGYAEQYAGRQGEDFNLITSSGPAATQTVGHIHVHYVPRRRGDGLHLPWTPQPALTEAAAQALRDAADAMETKPTLFVNGPPTRTGRAFYTAWLRDRADRMARAER